MNEEESREQHIKDAKKALAELDTMKCNIEGSGVKWADVIKNRRKHIESFLGSLEN
jgi:hypothetical protein